MESAKRTSTPFARRAASGTTGTVLGLLILVSAGRCFAGCGDQKSGRLTGDVVFGRRGAPAPRGSSELQSVSPADAANQPVDEESSERRMGVKDGVAVIAGSALGGGFLALPLVTAPMGIMPSVLGLAMAWAFLAALSAVFAEVSALTLKDKTVETGDTSRLLVEDEGVSIVSVAQTTLGDSAAILCSVAFLLQMLAIVTAQVAKSGELLQTFIGLPYIAGCLLPSILLGAFAFEMPAKIVERTNTLLTVSMVLGFGLLVVSTSMSKLSNLGVLLGALPMGSWGSLLPTVGTTTWALPIFFNLLCYGQSVPLVVERMGADRPSRVQTTILLGSLVPFVLGVIWVCIAALLGSDLDISDGKDPVLQLVQGPASIALPVLLLAAGAIGSTLIASYLALGQFAADALCASTGQCSIEDNQRAKMASVIVPAATACIGPQLYLPLLSFAGAFPAVLLYGILPPMALLLRREKSGLGRKAVLGALTAISSVFLLVNAWLWLTASLA